MDCDAGCLACPAHGCDGVLLDYMRFPNEEVQLDPVGAAAFDCDAPPAENAADRARRMQAFKESALTELMRLLHDALEEVRANFDIAIYSWGAHVAASHHVAQPWPAWAKAGYLHGVNVSGYCYPENYGERYLREFETRIRNAKNLLDASNSEVVLSVALGVKTSHGAFASHREIPLYMDLASRAGSRGVSVFAWRSLAPWKDDVVRAGYFRTDAHPMPPAPLRYTITADLGVTPARTLARCLRCATPVAACLPAPASWASTTRTTAPIG